MTLLEVTQMLDSIGLPYSYLMFPNEKAPALPYLVYYYPNSADVMADNKNYVPVNRIVIELYTETKDFQTEQLVESNLLFPYTKDETYIDSEKMFQITYESEIIIL